MNRKSCFIFKPSRARSPRSATELVCPTDPIHPCDQIQQISYLVEELLNSVRASAVLKFVTWINMVRTGCRLDEKSNFYSAVGADRRTESNNNQRGFWSGTGVDVIALKNIYLWTKKFFISNNLIILYLYQNVLWACTDFSFSFCPLLIDFLCLSLSVPCRLQVYGNDLPVAGIQSPLWAEKGLHLDSGFKRESVCSR